MERLTLSAPYYVNYSNSNLTWTSPWPQHTLAVDTLSLSRGQLLSPWPPAGYLRSGGEQVTTQIWETHMSTNRIKCGVTWEWGGMFTQQHKVWFGRNYKQIKLLLLCLQCVVFCYNTHPALFVYSKISPKSELWFIHHFILAFYAFTLSPPSPGIRMMGDLTPSLSCENNVPEVEDITDTNNTAVTLTLILSP